MGSDVSIWQFVLIVGISSALNGLLYTWSSVVFRRLFDGTAGFTVTESDHTLVLNSFLVSKIVGVFLVSCSMDRLGRRWTLTAFALLSFVGWLILLTGSSPVSLVMARICGGLYVSTQMSLIPVIIGETVEADERGFMASLSVFFSISFAFLSSLFISLEYTWFNFISGLPSLFLLVVSLFMYETPYYFLLKGDKEMARRSIIWLRGHCDEERLNKMEEHLRPPENSRTFSSLFEKKSRKAFMITLPLLIAITVGSPDVAYNYFFVIIPRHPLPIEGAYVISSFTCVTSLVLSTLTVNRIGRRLTTIVAFLGAAVCESALAIWYFNEDDQWGWFPTVGISFKFFFYYFGLETLPRLWLSEMFPIHVKGAASIVITTIKALITIVLIQSFYPIRKAVGEWLYFALSAVFFCLGVILSDILLFETNGKTLEGIQDDLANDSGGQGLRNRESHA